MNSNFRNLAIWVVIGLLLMALVQSVPESRPGPARQRDQLFRLPGRRRSRQRIGSNHRQAPHFRRLPRQEQHLHHHRARGPQPRRAAEQEGREDHGAASRGGRALDPGRAGQLVSHAAADRRVDLLHAPDAVGRRPRHGLRQVEGQAADRAAGPRHLRGRRGRRRGQDATCRRSSSSCAIRKSSSGSAAVFRAARCWSARPAPARR